MGSNEIQDHTYIAGPKNYDTSRVIQTKGFNKVHEDSLPNVISVIDESYTENTMITNCIMKSSLLDNEKFFVEKTIEVDCNSTDCKEWKEEIMRRVKSLENENKQLRKSLTLKVIH